MFVIKLTECFFNCYLLFYYNKIIGCVRLNNDNINIIMTLYYYYYDDYDIIIILLS